MHLIRSRRSLAVLLAMVVVLAAPSLLEAQTGKITGLVTDDRSGQPLEGVQVSLQGTGYGTVTQSNGRFFLVSVPPGTYTVLMRRLGYQAAAISGVQVRIDVTREVSARLSPATAEIAAVRIVAPPTPLVEKGITGSSQAIPSEVIEALPVTSVSGVLALQQGFLEVPQNTDITSFTDSRRNVLSPIRIRGGRAGETLTLLDGIPVNNVVFGGRAFDITTAAIQQLDYQKGGFEPQYGNALSGIINIATREGGRTLAGNVTYESSAFGGALGSTADELRGYDHLRGFLSGPVPGTAERLRFLVAGQTQSGHDAVYEFDRDVASSSRSQVFERFNQPNALDLFPGWRAFGFDQETNIFGKLTFDVTPESKISVSVLDYERQRRPFDFDYLFAGFDPLRAPAVRTIEDTLGVLGFASFGSYQGVVQGSIRADRRLYVATFEQRFGRSNLKLRAARFDQERETCNFFQGVCLGAQFADINFNERFVAPGITQGNPTGGTDEFFGGEKVNSNIFRADLESQATDHHNLQAGVFFQQHDIVFAEQRNLGTNNVQVVPQRYSAKPYDAAAYFQDRIEYDFLTIKLGFRFDYTKAKGTGFADPLNPLNGTSAREVCEGQFGGGGAATFVDTSFVVQTPTGATFTGLAACTHPNAPKSLIENATRVAQQDDFRVADARRAFSPRIGVSFPLTESSALFFNFGQYSQNPLYNNLYQNTGVGTVAGGTSRDTVRGDGICLPDQVKPGTRECYPTIFADAYTPAYIGNPNLLIERTTSYEVGYAAEIGRNYAVNVAVFSKDETGLTGIRQSERIQDIGNTYGTALPRYDVVVNQDYTTVRGVELQLRRGVANYWGYDINYSFSKATTNAQPPDRQQQSLQEGDPNQVREIRSEIDQPHVFNAALIFRVDDRTPSFRWGNLLRSSNLTVTVRAASGLPYTPTSDFFGFGDAAQGEQFSGRAPATFQVDLLAGKDIRVGATRYGLFARVVNLTDRKNCVQVFVTTGRCDAGTIDQNRARQGNSVGEGVSSTFFDRPQFYGPRRSILAGARVNF